MHQNITVVVYSCHLCILHAYRKEIFVSSTALRLMHSDIYLRSSLTLVSSFGQPNIYSPAYIVTPIYNSTLRILRRVNLAYDSRFNLDELADFRVHGSPCFHNLVIGIDHLLVTENRFITSYTRDTRCAHRLRNRHSLQSRLPPNILESGPIVIDPHNFVQNALQHASNSPYFYVHDHRTRYEMELSPQNATTIVSMLFPDLRHMTLIGQSNIQTLSGFSPILSIPIPTHRSILPCGTIISEITTTLTLQNLSLSLNPLISTHSTLPHLYPNPSTLSEPTSQQSHQPPLADIDTFNSLFGPHDLSISDHVFGFFLNYAEAPASSATSILTVSQNITLSVTALTNSTTGLIPRHPNPDPSSLYNQHDSPSLEALIEFLLRLHAHCTPDTLLKGQPHACPIPIRCPLSDIINNRSDISIRSFFTSLVEAYINTVLNVKQTPLAIFGLLSEQRCSKMPPYIRNHLLNCQPRR